MWAAGLVAGPVRWTQRWIARAQRKADLRAERFLRHDRAYANERLLHGRWPLAARPGDASPGLAEAWRTWVTDGPVGGPDGVRVTIWVCSAGQDLPFRDPPEDQAWLSWEELPEGWTVCTVCVRRMPAGPAREFCSFATETSARWYAVELAQQVRQFGITSLRPSDIFPERPRLARSECALAAEIIGARRGSGHGLLRLSRQARAHWRQVRTGRRRTHRSAQFCAQGREITAVLWPPC
jgi:hypothetical protein